LIDAQQMEQKKLTIDRQVDSMTDRNPYKNVSQTDKQKNKTDK